MSHDATDARAQKAADKAYAKASRPWYKKKRFIIPAVLVLLLIISQLLNTTDSANVTDTATADSAATTEAAPAASETTEAAASESTEEATSEPTDEATAEAPPAEEPPMEVTAQKMIEDLENNALGASNTYLDKRVSVSGTVGTVDSSGDYFTIEGTDEYSFTNVQVFIEEEHLPTVSAFSADQPVTVVGTVTMVGEVLGYSVQAETIS